MQQKELPTTKFESLKDAVVHFLKECKYNYELQDDSEIITLNMYGDNGRWAVVIIAEEDRKLLHIRSICPVSIKDAQKLKMSELLARINNQLLLVNFVFNLEEGLIVCQSMNLFLDGIINNDVLHILFNKNISTMDDFLPAITAVNSGYTEPVLAINHQ